MLMQSLESVEPGAGAAVESCAARLWGEERAGMEQPEVKGLAQSWGFVVLVAATGYWNRD
jgi:hypothetical protein